MLALIIIARLILNIIRILIVILIVTFDILNTLIFAVLDILLGIQTAIFSTVALVLLAFVEYIDALLLLLKLRQLFGQTFTLRQSQPVQQQQQNQLHRSVSRTKRG